MFSPDTPEDKSTTCCDVEVEVVSSYYLSFLLILMA